MFLPVSVLIKVVVFPSCCLLPPTDALQTPSTLSLSICHAQLGLRARRCLVRVMITKLWDNQLNWHCTASTTSSCSPRSGARIFCRYFDSNLGHTIVGLAGNDNCTYLAGYTPAVHSKPLLPGHVQSRPRCLRLADWTHPAAGLTKGLSEKHVMGAVCRTGCRLPRRRWWHRSCAQQHPQSNGLCNTIKYVRCHQLCEMPSSHAGSSTKI